MDSLRVKKLDFKNNAAANTRRGLRESLIFRLTKQLCLGSNYKFLNYRVFNPSFLTILCLHVSPPTNINLIFPNNIFYLFPGH